MKTFTNNFIQLVLAIVLVFNGYSCKSQENKETKVLLSTKYGEMTIKLYDETPKHRDNFIELVNNEFYDGLLFHRVIKGFMVQGGDPESKGASANKRLGSGGPGYLIPAEFVEGKYHKRGALAAARQGDNANPEKKSSGSQFYIVQGKVYTDEMLDKFEEQQKFSASRKLAMKLFQERMDEVKAYQEKKEYSKIDSIKIAVEEQAETAIDESQFEVNQERREVYKTVGGTPFLDGSYTVFGEVIDGFYVLDSIAAVETNDFDRPLEDVIMEFKVLD